MQPKESPRSQSGQIVCRICLSDDITSDNPLISPCKCSGTMKMIHIECLRSWLNSKCSIKDNNSVKTYCWKAMECELCKHRLPDRIPDPKQAITD
jgi:E3 ubiquitin-protein ligase DOA10